MKSKQIQQLLAALAKGIELDAALASLGISRRQYEATLDADPEIGEVINETVEQARMGSVVESREQDLSDVIDAMTRPLPPREVPDPSPQRPAARVLPPEDEPRRGPEKVEPDAVDEDESDEEPETDYGPLDKATVMREAAELAPGPFGYLLWLNQRLVDSGFHKMSAWWLFALQAFYASAKRFGLFLVGRGGGKSTSLTRVAGADGLFGERVVPPGQRFIWPFISVSTDDANRRILEIQAILGAVRIFPKIKRPNNSRAIIEIYDINRQPIAYVSIAGTIAALSGPTSIGGTIDEEAKLRDKTHNANPASELIASFVQTFRSNPNVRAIRCSSAWTDQGSHSEAIREGDNASNHVARIGAPFLDHVIEGLKAVEELERSRGNVQDAQKIVSFYASLTPESPNVPTWLANPTISAIASRMEVDALPAHALGGLSRAVYWLRENASLPLSLTGPTVTAETMRAYQDLNQRLAAKGRAPLLEGSANADSAEAYWSSICSRDDGNCL